jgi:predicted small secreted protein
VRLVLTAAVVLAALLLAGCGSGSGSGSQSGGDPVSEAKLMRHERAAPLKRNKREDPIPTFERPPPG